MDPSVCCGPMRFHMLGGLMVTDGDEPLDLGTPKQRAVVAVLLLERDQVVSSDRLVELLWGDDADKALVSLRAYVSRLRAVLEPDRRPRDPAAILVSQSPGYRLVVPRADVDLYQFEDDVAAGRRLVRAGDHAGAVAVLDAALERWTGPVLPELASEAFVVDAATRAEDVRLSAAEAVAEAWLGLGDAHEARIRLEREAESHLTRERLQGLLALALYRSERQADALRVVDRCRRALLEDHGLDLGADLKRLETDLLTQSPVLDPDPVRIVARTVATGRASSVAAPTSPSPAPSPTTTVAPTAPSPTTSVTLSPTVAPTTTIVGRSSEQRVLHDALAAAAGGHGSIVVLVGDAGIGKTRLAETAVEAASPAGFATAWARCPESRATPPFWVVTQLREQLAAQLRTTTSLAASADASMRSPDPADEGPAGRADQTEDGFGRYRSVLGEIVAIDHPILVVVDDLQWADPDSLRLVEQLAADLASTRVVVVATTRPLDDHAPDALVDCLAEIARIPSSRQLEVGGLTVADVADWLDGRDDVAVPVEVAALVHDRTGGNPLFVKELTELLAAEGRLDDVAAVADSRAIPPGVRFVVRRRVSRLPRSTQQLLSTAAVVGSPFRIDTLAAIAEVDEAQVLTDLVPALDEGLLVEARGDLAFSHALVADALAGEINPARSAAIHAAAARALAASAGPGFGTDAAVVAHHALAGILAGTGDLAVDASRRAAEVASSRFAHEDAAAHWGDTALALAKARPGDAAARIDALIAQAEALTMADVTEAAKAPILAAVDAAGAAGLVDAMIRAASLLNYTHVWTNEAYGVVDDRLVDALERTLAAIGEGDTPERAVLLGALASELVFADPARHIQVCAEAERAARAAGDPIVLARVLNNLMLPNRPGQLGVRRRNADEMVALADAHPLPPGLVFAGHHHVAEAHLEVGDLGRVADEVVAARRVLDRMPRSHLHGMNLWTEAVLATATGRYDEASDLVTRAHELHRRGRDYDADTLLLGATAAIAIDHGGLDDLIPFAVATVGTTAYERTSAECVAFGMLEAGRDDLARSLVEPFGPGAGFPDDFTTLAGATAALHVRVELADLDGAAPIAQLLAPYASRWAGAGNSPLSLGPVRLALARHRCALGDDEGAAELLAASVAMTEANGAVAWLARSLTHQAAFLVSFGDVAGAEAARSRAGSLADRYGLPYVRRRLDRLDAN